ncbi:MAG TPA: adenylyltransferase/cytidyltransferase family protein, partial [Methanocorpusculum sp.]|nr:adenylyltransferase/cytidyltransferase family protein [Methanocorpusculum sp.]
MKVMVGGTFDMLHIGHKALLRQAFETAGTDGFVIIGLSSDEFAGRKQHPVHTFETRKKELMDW